MQWTLHNIPKGKTHYVIKEDEIDHGKAMKQVCVELIRNYCAVFEGFVLIFVGESLICIMCK